MRRVLVLTMLALLFPLMPDAQAQDKRNDPKGRTSGKSNSAQDDPVSMGKPLSHWMKVIRARDIEESEMAFDAIFELGPKAWRAVPELTQILEDPFEPIQMGTDSRAQIREKLLDIHLRSGAIDSLGAIGPAAASAARPAIRWGLTTRVVATTPLSARDRFFIDLVGVDVLERMRVAGAVASFGLAASGAVQELVESADLEKQKFAAAILTDGAVRIATVLMQSENCEARLVGLSLLSGMWPVVSKDHLTTLKEALSCEGFGLEPKLSPRMSPSSMN